MTVQVIISKEMGDMPIDEISDYLDGTILRYLILQDWIIDNISII